MQGRVAIVTGGTGAIGTEICRHLHQAGCRVAATCHPVDTERAPQWREQRRAEGADMMVVVADISDFEAAAQAVRQVEAELGPIAVLVNAAGITRDATLRKMTPAQWQEVIHSNLDTVFNMARNVVEGMTERGFGRIISISSINGQKGQFGQTNYSASKAGMHGFTMALAQEVARKGVTVNTISPGYIETPMVMAVPEDVRKQIIAQIPVGRLGRPEEIARIVAFLAAEESGYITGADFSANGGQHMG